MHQNTENKKNTKTTSGCRHKKEIVKQIIFSKLTLVKHANAPPTGAFCAIAILGSTIGLHFQR